MGSTTDHVISIRNGEGGIDGSNNNNNTEEPKGFKFSVPPLFSKRIHSSIVPITSYLRDQKRSEHDTTKVIHSIKVGVSLVLVSLFYLLDPLYEQVGDNAMWAIMTVVVIFEFYAGATLGKGLNRGMGTILGGGLGCLAAVSAQLVGGVGNSIIIGTSVFIFGGGATYCRLNPSIKKRYDYGVLIFILTFNLVVVSGVRAEEVLKLARDRLLAIVMGFIVCISVSLFVFPLWTSDELHHSTVSKFHDLANSTQGFLEEYFKLEGEKEDKPGAKLISTCKSLLNSKSKDESLANFAKWEPWHGRFGSSYPWDKYLKIAGILRDLASIVLSLGFCLQSSRQPMDYARQSVKEPCEAIGSCIAWSLRELGNSIKETRKLQREPDILGKLKAVRTELNTVISTSKIAELENGDGLAIAGLVLLLNEVIKKVAELAKEIEELGELASFHTHH